ncbi:hypothetical protein HRR83_008176 [Exophiala dermatitidis]|uniref:Uncharacterized protein n=1 Tax=Exophiala dermatitidis TaxID=5970 RepID=A0AAN6EQY2_EXODE|nr:hypothetical protein HRR74_007869 [Exophiala dermatitidis]KAJ4513606.1 hypothetical protein HRR73_005764 [Exophiala dermatitidis]KAJ4535550.1 hypothetical protein HRR77_007869 [Exophiala dermatitidis]KAJ4544474.1 hypothetical protein HRR76_002533 [Exophiala dermatitidis]KAJ4561461.1 hypothetical protein HRR79_007291 [Exophiala dermatitidis]
MKDERRKGNKEKRSKRRLFVLLGLARCLVEIVLISRLRKAVHVLWRDVAVGAGGAGRLCRMRLRAFATNQRWSLSLRLSLPDCSRIPIEKGRWLSPTTIPAAARRNGDKKQNTKRRAPDLCFAFGLSPLQVLPDNVSKSCMSGKGQALRGVLAG